MKTPMLVWNGKEALMSLRSFSVSNNISITRRRKRNKKKPFDTDQIINKHK